MTDFCAKVRGLSAAAWSLRAASGRPCTLPFALALFTDDRRQPDLCGMLAALPTARQIPPLLVVFRHDGLGRPERRALARQACALVKAKGHLIVTARMQLDEADGTHAHPGRGVRTVPVHSLAEGIKGHRSGADLGFVSPIFRTQSHPCSAGLGAARASMMAQQLVMPCFALGGMNADSARRLRGSPFQGLAAIGAFSD